MNNSQRWAVLLGFTLVAVAFVQAVGYVGGTLGTAPIECGRAFEDPAERLFVAGEEVGDDERPTVGAWCRNAIHARRALVFSFAVAGAMLCLVGYLVFNRVSDRP